MAFMSARELCGRLLNKRKEKYDAEFGVFRGFEESCLRIKWLMKKASGESVGVGGTTGEEYVKKMGMYVWRVCGGMVQRTDGSLDVW